MKHRRTGLVILTLVITSITGCIFPERAPVALKIKSDLSATVSCDYYNLKPGADTPEKQLAEMKQFYDGDYLKLAGMIKENWRLDEMEVVLKNKTGTACNATLTGTTGSVIPLFAAMDFNVTRDGNRYTFVHRPEKKVDPVREHLPEPYTVFSITFDGPIVDHNATRFDAGKWIMEWDGRRLEDTDILFVIKVKPGGEFAPDVTVVGELTGEVVGPVKPVNKIRPALFVDTSLEQVVREAAGKPDGPLLAGDLERITGLDASGSRIVFLGGIEQLVNLEIVDLNNNNIKFLDPLSSLPALREVDLAENHIKEVDGLSGARAVEVLDLSHNHLREVAPLAVLDRLKRLNISGNYVGGNIKNLGRMKSLQALIMVNENLVDARALAGFENLVELNLAGAQVRAGLEGLADLKKLASLDLSHTRIDDLRFLSRCRGLKRLKLVGSQVDNIGALSALNKLKDLDLSHNRIEFLEPLSSLTNLTRLDLSYNRIKNPGPLEKLTRMTFLDLSANHIEDISVLRQMNRLMSLSLADNRIADISRLGSLVKVRFLDLSKNLISDLKPLVKTTSIAYGDIVWLDENPLDAEDLADIKVLEDRRVRVGHTIAKDGGSGK